MKNGPYILIIAPAEYPGKKYRGRYVYEHHFVWWCNTGEIIEPGWIIHHKNENKHDNSFGNLEKQTARDHVNHHREPSEVMVCNCGWCGKVFKGLAREMRHRFKKSASGLIFCSKSCQVRSQRNAQRFAK